jgi:hypothetical protein
MSTRILFIALPALLVTAVCYAEPIDLIAGLNNGQLWAEFRGAGDRAVTGTIGRTGEGPLEVNIPGWRAAGPDDLREPTDWPAGGQGGASHSAYLLYEPGSARGDSG